MTAIGETSAERISPAQSALAWRIHAGAEALARLAAPGIRPITPFQQAAWLSSLLGATGATDAFRVVEIDAAGGSVLLPLEAGRLGPFRVADIAGGKQASFHGVAMRGEPILPPDAFRAALREAGEALGLDAFTFRDAPISWLGEAHPFASLAARPSPSAGWAVTLEAECETLFARLSNREDRKKQRYKANKLAQIGPVTGGWITDEAEISEALTKLFAWKAARFGAVGIDNPFEDPAMQAFLRAGSAGRQAPLRIFALSAGERLVAVMVCAIDGRACSGMVNAHDPDPEIAKTSPGEQLLMHLLRRLCAEGFRQFDLGIGEARYKAHFCPEPVALIDAALAISAKGRLAALLFVAMRRLKRRVKQDPRLWALVMRYRRWKAGQAAASSARPG